MGDEKKKKWKNKSSVLLPSAPIPYLPTPLLSIHLLVQSLVLQPLALPMPSLTPQGLLYASVIPFSFKLLIQASDKHNTPLSNLLSLSPSTHNFHPDTPTTPNTDMTMVPQLTGKAAMLAPGSKKAPVTFNGNELDVAEFMDVYECCIDDAQLPRSDWVPFLFRYLSRDQRDIFEASNGVDTAEWDTFKASIHESFAGAFKTKKYTMAYLDQFIRQSPLTPIQSDPAPRAYHHQFLVITNYLIKEKEMETADRDQHYWFSLHPHMRMAIEQWLAITLPDHPRSRPYAVADIYKAGCYVFNT
jgi:hypothetical protein